MIATESAVAAPAPKLQNAWKLYNKNVQALLREIERLGENDDQHNDRR